ncbi:RICIN domain-containing protein [Actinomadura rubrobrunea]|nr:RICIN domain-containing protein [Actinomadura rubrobrunea]
MRFPLTSPAGPVTARRGLAAAALLALVTPLTSPVADASETSRLRNAHRVRVVTFSDKCLDVSGGVAASGTPIIQYSCQGSANQRFWLVAADGGRYEIRTLHDKCLDVARESARDETAIIQYACDGTANQKFRLRRVRNGRYEIRTLHDKCLDVRGASTANNVPIIQYRCRGTANQRFRFDSV